MNSTSFDNNDAKVGNLNQPFHPIHRNEFIQNINQKVKFESKIATGNRITESVT